MTGLFWITGRVSLVAAVLILLSGCSRGPQTPLERAHSLFLDSEFDAALKVCDDAIASTKQREELASLHLLRGQCLLNQAHQLDMEKRNDLATQKYEKAIRDQGLTLVTFTPDQTAQLNELVATVLPHRCRSG